MRYEIMSTIKLGDVYVIKIKDNHLKGECIVRSDDLENVDSELRLFVESKMYFIRNGLIKDYYVEK